MDNSTPCVVVFGHSFVRRLRDFLFDKHRSHDGTRKDWINLDIPRTEINIFFHGIGGLTLSAARDELASICELETKAIVLQIGENDLDSTTCHCPLALAGEVFAFARTLQKATDASCVIVCELLPHLQTRRAHYDVFLHRVNKQLKVLLAASTSLLLWPHFGLWKNWQQNFIADGIHFNLTSQGKYYRSIRGAVLRAARQLQEECGNR